MRGRGVPLNVHTYSALLNVCLKANELELGLDVYEQMLAEGVAPNLVRRGCSEPVTGCLRVPACVRMCLPACVHLVQKA